MSALIEELKRLYHEDIERERRAKAPATTAAVEPPRAFRVGDRIRGNSTKKCAVVVAVTDGLKMSVRYDNEDYDRPNAYQDEYALVRPADDGEPAWLVEARKHAPAWAEVSVGTWDREPGLRVALAGTNHETNWSPGHMNIRSGRWGAFYLGARETMVRRGVPATAFTEPTIADGKAVLPKPPSAPLPDLSLTNEVGFPTMPPRTISAFDEYVRNISPDVDGFVAHQEAVTKQAYAAMAIPKPPPRDDVATYLATRTEPAEPEHVYREGDVVVVTHYPGGQVAPFVATVARAHDCYVCIWWRDWSGDEQDDELDASRVRPATAREKRTGRVER